MIVRQDNTLRIKIERPSEQLARGHTDIGLSAVCNYLLCNDFSGVISEDRDHAFFGEVLHCREQVRPKHGLAMIEIGAHETFT